MPLDGSGRKHLLRASFLMLVGLWFAGGTERISAAMDCNVNETCEAGENCVNCPSDCECFCGDNVCYGEEYQDEQCWSCPEDCESLCNCGDGNCDFPAEGGNIAWATCEQSGNPECTTCMIDCWDCKDNFDCFLMDLFVCNGGLCEECQDYGDCEEWASWECFGEAECDFGRCRCLL